MHHVAELRALAEGGLVNVGRYNRRVSVLAMAKALLQTLARPHRERR